VGYIEPQHTKEAKNCQYTNKGLNYLQQLLYFQLLTQDTFFLKLKLHTL